ncbi:hypothetical protein C2845_PM10G02560 [Panicum miliaceum]|uniref:Uncharacterized protein n=1 Tax=Panicum miliaceum TaxID=4540 RepID=A0A3L6PIE8_PANMI|nr:hypothetical protein C2845_PM10G02560 [Panicum miliaceum]
MNEDATLRHHTSLATRCRKPTNHTSHHVTCSQTNVKSMKAITICTELSRISWPAAYVTSSPVEIIQRWGSSILLMKTSESAPSSLLAVEKQGPEPRAGGSGGHRVHHEADGRRHQRRDPGGEHRREQRRQQPDRGPGRRPAPAPFLPALEPAEEVEEQRDGGVGAGDETAERGSSRDR